MVARWPFHAITPVVAARAGSTTLLLTNFRSERPQRTEMVPNRRFWNGAVIAAVEAVAVERGDDPDSPGFDFVGAIGPRVEGPLQVVTESTGAVGKELSIDSNSICAHLDLVTWKCDDGFEERRSAIWASPRSAILTAEGNGCCRRLRTKLDKIRVPRTAGDVEAERKGWCEIKTDAKNPSCNESEKERRGQQTSPENSAAEALT
jgi:hypothetical protein